MLQFVLNQVTQADLNGAGLRLVEVPAHERLNELGFSLPARHVDLAALAAILTDAGLSPPTFDNRPLSGYLRGTIDCVFRHRGRFYLADWKSNYLGPARSDYCGASLRLAMVQGGYMLQYALYSLAVHRFLRLRLDDYDYERHFGGVFYVFARGVQPGWMQPEGQVAGVYRDRLDRTIIDALDVLFAGLSVPGIA